MKCFNSFTSLSHALPAPAPSAVLSHGGDGEVAVGEVGPSASIAESSKSSPGSGAEAPHTLDVSQEYAKAVQTSSYNEIWTKIHGQASSLGHVEVLNPDRDSIEQALQLSQPNKLTRLVSDYFESSENTSKLFLVLQRSIESARALYGLIRDLLDHAPSSPSSSFVQSQCDWAFEALCQFHLRDNPFPADSNFDHMRLCFSQLRQQLDHHLRRARSSASPLRCSASCSAVALIGTTLGIAISAVVIATHALGALVAAPLLTFLPAPCKARQRFLHRHISQLNAAAVGTYVLHNDLYTIERLVVRLHATVESDKHLVRYSMEHSRDKFTILEVVKQLRKNHPNFLKQLKDLEEHVCLCFTSLNRARSLLLQEIHLHKSHNSCHYCLSFHDY